MQVLVNSIGDLDIGGKWKQKVSKNAKPGKQAIQSFCLDKSFSFGIGTGKYGSLLHLKGLRSRFSSHSYKFAEDSLKRLLNAPIGELEELRRSLKFDAKEQGKE